ncbi:MAG: D-aminoacyl-tRNA deacylase [Cyclobacteriaceae bacterium]
MKIVIQRVLESQVTIHGKTKGKIGHGLMLLLGIEEADNDEDITWLVNKTLNLRIFNDENGVMNKSLMDVNGEVLLISQFTLHASTKKGNRPSYILAAKPETAIPIYEKFIATTEHQLGRKIQTGEFGADMKVSLVNDGPVTIVIDTKDKK